MKTQLFEDKDAWFKARMGRITGTRLKDLVSKRGGRKIGFYEIIAERVAIAPDDEPASSRGIRLEDEAIKRFEQETGKTVDTSLVIWSRDDEENIAISPDGFIGDTEAVECKCLSSARHIEALLTKKIPDDYDCQALQYFIVNDNLQVLHFVFYDPRMPKDFFYYDIKREDVQTQVDEYLDLERAALQEIEEIEQSLTF